MTTSIGIDVGGTKTLGVLVERGSGGVSVLDREQLPSDAASPSAVDVILRVGGTLLERNAGRDIEGVGVGLAGFVDLDGVVRAAPNSPGLIDQDVRGRIEATLGVTGLADNDANCVAVAAHRIVAPGARHLVAVTLGTGIGGGVILDGKLLRGANGFAGEPGHMVIEYDGLLCPCGQRGCWEVYASGSGLERLAREAVEAGRATSLLELAGSVDAVQGEHVTELLAAGDADALAIFERYAGYVAVGLANLLVLLDPEIIVIGGGVSRHGALLLELITREFDDGYPSAVVGRASRILVAPDGPDAGAIGAAVLGAQRLASHESVAGHGGPGE